jgi:phosphoesterase RecJ-like protein
VNPDLFRVQDMLAEAMTIAIVSHERPDGDAIGSLLALTLSLEKTGKQVTPVLVDGVPGRFRFLPGAERVQRILPDDFDLLIFVDCAELERSGLPPKAFSEKPHINIDHHPTNTHFGLINIVSSEAAAVAEMIYDLAVPLGLPLDQDVATNLLAALVTDTIGFRTPNVTPKVLDLAARLIELGAQLADVYEKSLNQRSFVAARYWGRGLSRLEKEDGIVWTSLTLDDRKSVGYPGGDDADLVNLLTTIEDAEVTLIFVEQPKRKVKVSWRSRAGLNIAKLAATFGGGGHDQAAGATLDGELESVMAKVLSVTRSILDPERKMGQ